MNWLSPRTLRGQLILGIVLLESIFLVLFAILLVVQERHGVRQRAVRRLENQATLLSIEAGRSIEVNHLEWLNEELAALLASRAIEAVRITDLQGNILAERRKVPFPWKLAEVDHSSMNGDVMVLPFSVTGDRGEGIALIRRGDKKLGYAWVMEDPEPDQAVISSMLKNALGFGLVALLSCVALSTLLAQSITSPLAVLMQATRRLVLDPTTSEGFPLHISETNEAAELARAFNRLVASIAEQSAGLNNTLALLDSMLAHAPIGFAFFDREYRYVRVNRFLSDASGIEARDYLGRRLHDFFGSAAAALLAQHIDGVFESGETAHDLEVAPHPDDVLRGNHRFWVVNLYPAGVGHDEARWVGAVFIDATNRVRSEEALRKSEKLAATGRLAASIAHEINNPLEAVTNLLYLLQRHPSLDAEARELAVIADQEVARISIIAQRTLRFYRQSTLPAEANLADVLESVLPLHEGRFKARMIRVDRTFADHAPLFCFAGELRQVFANLIGNALDASPEGARLLLRVRRSYCWKTNKAGVRITIADTGCGMPEAVRRRIFEPFFTTKDATGTGLGLWISSEILERHGARIAVRSRTAGAVSAGSSIPLEKQTQSGTVFMLLFPEGAVAGQSISPLAQSASA